MTEDDTGAAARVPRSRSTPAPTAPVAPGTPAARPSAGVPHDATARQVDVLGEVLRAAPVGMAFLDRELCYLRINEALATVHGLPAGDHVGRSVAQVVPEQWAVLEPVLRSVLAGETVVEREVAVRAADGTDRTFTVSYYPLWVEGQVAGVGCIASDVTVARRTEEALRLRSRLYEMLAATNRAVARSTSTDDLFPQVCTIAVQAGGFEFAWIGVPDGDRVRRVASAGIDNGYVAEAVITLTDDDPRTYGPTGQAVRTGVYTVVNDFLNAPMAAPWHEAAARVGVGACASFPIRQAGRVAAALTLYASARGTFTPEIVATLAEMTPSLSFALDRFAREEERKHDEIELRLRDRAINALSQGVVLTDARALDDPICFASPSFERLVGYTHDEVVGRNCRFLQGAGTDPEAIAELHRAVAAGSDCTVELLNYRKDGTPFWNNVSVSPVRDDSGEITHFVGVQTDVTERRELEQQLLHAQKLEAIGTLAGGIAHDFNNMLLVIRGYSSLLARRLPDGDLQDAAHRIDAAVERAAGFTRKLLAFSRQQVLWPEVTDLNALVSDTLGLLEHMLGSDVELVVELADDLPALVIDRSQVEQALLNLVTNARDAMPTGGVLTVRTDAVDLGESYAAMFEGASPGLHVLLQVSDTGAGMDEETQNHAFDPFFTTKDDGTGLGLSIVYGLAKQSGGHVRLHSEVGVGTTLKLYLPATGDAVPASATKTAPTRLDGNETVLVVEDDEEARALLAAAFTEHGYRVLEAGDGAEALDAVRRARIDVLVTDVVLPGTDGCTLATQLAAERPDLRVVYTSGHVTDVASSEDLRGPRARFVAKPYLAEDVLHAVRQLLDRPAG
jgi:two-component system cell cycle sensor histidine kinase/response regulator CckA